MTARGSNGNGSGRRVPLTYNRAATAVVRSGLFIERARQEARMALEILSELGPQAQGERADDVTMMRLIVEYLDRLSTADPPRWMEGSIATDGDRS